MKLADVDVKKLLPEFMQRDLADTVLADTLSQIIQELTPRLFLLSEWNHIDDMSDSELDELAWELDIIWYIKNTEIDTKRRLIKESDLVHSRLGTKYAVEEVINAYFGLGEVQEWFEYEGQSGFFRIITTNTSLVSSKIDEFLTILEVVKRKSAHLDGLILRLGSGLDLYQRMAYQDSGTEIYKIVG